MSFALDDEQMGNWLREGGPHGDVVISSRVRLARNIAGFPFLSKTDARQQSEIIAACKDFIMQSQLAPQLCWIDLVNATPLERRMLVERHLISRQHAESQSTRAVVISGNEQLAIMVNEEDHLRIQVLRPGLQIDDVIGQANTVDDTIERNIDFAFSPNYGYLTACPTNVGTGLRLSVMLHLPALKLTGEIDKVKRAAKDMHLAIRGSYGEGTETLGDMFQISNQVTLGKTEAEIMTDFRDVVIPKIIEYESKARKALVDRRTSIIDDKIHRAWGILSHAHLLGGEETQYLLSYVRLGAVLRRLDYQDVSRINELFILTRSAHLQKIADQTLTGMERRAFRAQFVREQLNMR